MRHHRYWMTRFIELVTMSFPRRLTTLTLLYYIYPHEGVLMHCFPNRARQAVGPGSRMRTHVPTPPTPGSQTMEPP